MDTLWKLDVSDIVNYTGPFTTAALVIGFLALSILLIDHVDILLRTWHVRTLPRVTSQTFWKTRFRQRLGGTTLEDALRNAYNSFSKKGKAFATKADLENWMVLLPVESMKEWCNLPYDHLNFTTYLEKTVAMGYHTQVDCQTHLGAILAFNQKRYLDNLRDFVVNDTDEHLPQILGKMKGKEWTDFHIANLGSSILMLISTSVVLGPQFAKDEELMKEITSHVFGIDEIVMRFAEYPRMLWPLVWQLHPLNRKFRSNAAVLKRKLIPDMKRRARLLRSGEDTKEDLTMLTLFLKLALKDGILTSQEGDKVEEQQFDSLLMKTMFHIYEIWGPVAQVVNAMLMRVMASPEYIGDLREEVSDSLATVGGWQGDVVTPAQTPKLESFTREILRLYAPILVSVSRRVNMPLKIDSLNMSFEKGAYIGIPTKFIHTDPDNYPDPMAFNPLRFYNKLSKTSTARATTTSDTFLPFGCGTVLCPGRFLGVKIAQIVFAKLLTEYEVQFASKEQKFPPMNVLENTWTYPDADFTAHIRRRTASP